jgi:hypothetical protein
VTHAGEGTGLSWTTDREKAVWFARRFPGPEPRVLTGRTRRGNVIAYFAGRQEAEVIVLPEDVEVVAVTSIEPSPR